MSDDNNSPIYINTVFLAPANALRINLFVPHNIRILGEGKTLNKQQHHSKRSYLSPPHTKQREQKQGFGGEIESNSCISMTNTFTASKNSPGFMRLGRVTMTCRDDLYIAYRKGARTPQASICSSTAREREEIHRKISDARRSELKVLNEAAHRVHRRELCAAVVFLQH